MPLIDSTAILRELDRRSANARAVEFAAEVLYVLGRACPFPAVVYYVPDYMRHEVRAAGARRVSDRTSPTVPTTEECNR